LKTLKDKDWDASIMRLAEVPQVLKMMNDHLEWTTQLGNAFLAQPDKLMDAIQGLRRRAKQSGFLKDTPEQKVSVKTEDSRQAPAPAAEGGIKAQPAVYKKEVVYIEPAKPDTLYVPQYKPEVAYQAPLAPPPGNLAQYATTGYYPATTTTTTTTNSSSNDLMTFGMGALAGGLLTWGIMEWAHHDDWDDYYYRGGYYPPVSHYYGGAVCRYGNCWNGGGYWDRGNVNRNVNISGNEINIDRSRTFNQDQLANLKAERQPWNHDALHRRGAEYPANVRDRIGQIDRPGLAGGRLGSAETLPANVRGFDGKGGGLGQERRPSADQIRESLSQGTRLRDSAPVGKLADRQAQGRPAVSDRLQGGQGGQRPNALEGLRDAGAGAEQRRGAESRAKLQERRGGAENRAEPGGRERAQPAQNLQPKREAARQPRAERPKAQGGRDFSQARAQQKRVEAERPNAFEGVRDAGRTRDFSQRGAASRQDMASRFPAGGGGLQNRGGGGFQGGGGGLQNRGGGGGFQGGGAFQNRGGGGFQGGGGGGFGNRGGGGGGGFRGRR
jgi:hypothetical protein